MADVPSVLFVSSCSVAPNEIIHSVLKVSEPVGRFKIDDDIEAYPYHIDNKYYSTDINLCSLKRKIIASERFASTVQGTVIYFDSRENDCLKSVESWLPFLNDYQSEIKMLVCQNCSEEPREGCSKRLVQEWCIGKGYELVELEPVADDENDDDDFPETTGVNRIIQALNAHVWPNLIMKSQSESTRENNGVDTELSAFINEMCLEETLEELLDSNEEFSDLFSRLPEMKAQLSALQGAERFEAAGKIVEAFWKAMDDDQSSDAILDL